jgi:hypothetical protein
MTGFYQNNYSGEPEKDGEIQILYKGDFMASFTRRPTANAGETATTQPKESWGSQFLGDIICLLYPITR